MGCDLSAPETAGNKRSLVSVDSLTHLGRRRKSKELSPNTTNHSANSANQAYLYGSYTPMNENHTQPNSKNNSGPLQPRSRGGSGLNYSNTGPAATANITKQSLELEGSLGDNPNNNSTRNHLTDVNSFSNGTGDATSMRFPSVPSDRLLKEKIRRDKSIQPQDHASTVILDSYCISPSLSSTGTGHNNYPRQRLTAASLVTLEESMTSTAPSASLGLSNCSPPHAHSLLAMQVPRMARPHELAMAQLHSKLLAAADRSALALPLLPTPPFTNQHTPELETALIETDVIMGGSGKRLKNTSPVAAAKSLGVSSTTLPSSPGLVIEEGPQIDNKLAAAISHHDPAASTTSMSASPSASMCSPPSRRLPFALNTRVKGPKKPFTVPTDDELRQTPAFQEALRQAIEYNATTKEDFTPLTLDGLGAAIQAIGGRGSINMSTYNNTAREASRSVGFSDGTDDLCF